MSQKIREWIDSGIPAHHIAVLARQWDTLSPVRALLENSGVQGLLAIPTYALKRNDIRLIRNSIACRLIDALQTPKIFSSEESIEAWLHDLLIRQWHRSPQEPTVRTLFRIANDLDRERGYGSEYMATPISTDEILTAIFEYNETGDVLTEENAVLVTSCHGAKGLEFRKVILLSHWFRVAPRDIESDRRLFYVAMTRAKDELILCSGKQPHRFVKETGIRSVRMDLPKQALVQVSDLQKNNSTNSSHRNFCIPKKMLYMEMTPRDVYLGYRATTKAQDVIRELHEGEELRMCADKYEKNWMILTDQGQEIGKLSKKGNYDLIKKRMIPGQFRFGPGEVTVRSIYHHIGIDNVTGKILEDWFVVIPRIRVCR